jgi:hypothetical protein
VPRRSPQVGRLMWISPHTSGFPTLFNSQLHHSKLRYKSTDWDYPDYAVHGLDTPTGFFSMYCLEDTREDFTNGISAVFKLVFGKPTWLLAIKPTNRTVRHRGGKNPTSSLAKRAYPDISVFHTGTDSQGWLSFPASAKAALSNAPVRKSLARRGLVLHRVYLRERELISLPLGRSAIG